MCQSNKPVRCSVALERKDSLRPVIIVLQQIFLIALVATGFHYFIKIRKWTEWDKSFIYKHSPGPCKQVLSEGGSEDLTHIGDGLFLVSTGYNLGSGLGDMKLLDISKHTPEIHTLNITNAPNKPDFMTSPHGIATWRDSKTGVLTLYVVTHPPMEDRIEVFELHGTRVLNHVRTITDPQFKYMNDLVMTGKDQFYITKFLTFRDKLKVNIDLVMQDWGEIYYYDGSRSRRMASGLRMPNGINMSPDGSMIYMSDFGAKVLIGFRRDQSNNELTKIWTFDMDTSVDNIEIDERTGDLWIGCHPLKYVMLDLYNIFKWPHPSQVLRVKLSQGAVSEVEEVYTDDSREIAGTSVASRYNSRLVIGSVNAQLLVCDMK